MTSLTSNPASTLASPQAGLFFAIVAVDDKQRCPYHKAHQGCRAVGRVTARPAAGIRRTDCIYYGHSSEQIAAPHPYAPLRKAECCRLPTLDLDLDRSSTALLSDPRLRIGCVGLVVLELSARDAWRMSILHAPDRCSNVVVSEPSSSSSLSARRMCRPLLLRPLGTI